MGDTIVLDICSAWVQVFQTVATSTLGTAILLFVCCLGIVGLVLAFVRVRGYRK